MKNSLFFSPARLLALAGMCFLASPVFAQTAQNNAKIAGLEQDVAAMREEIQKLRDEVQDLRSALAKAQSNNNNNAAADAAVQRQINAQNAAHAEALRTLEGRINKRIGDLGAAFNRALAEQDKKVNAALASAGTRTGGGGAGNTDTPAPGTPPAIPSDMPRTGISHTIKSGDTVGKIARQYNSRTVWVLAANKLTERAARSLKVGDVLFVPFKETPAQPPSPPAPPPEAAEVR